MRDKIGVHHSEKRGGGG